MALADWLNPAPPPPSYLTSRAAGVVVPEFYRAATDLRKNALSLAGDEQNIRLREEGARREAQAEARRKAEEDAAAAILPQLAQLDPTKPTYFTDLSRVMTSPGGANALASESVRSFLDIAGGARSENLRLEEESRSEKRRLDEEDRIQGREVEREIRADARSNLEGAERLAQKYAEDLGDEDFLSPYAEKLTKIREVQKTKPDAVPSMLNSLTEEMTRDANQRTVRNRLLDGGVSLAKIEELKKLDGGKLGLNARAEIGRLNQRASATSRMTAQVSVLESELKDPTTNEVRKREIRNEINLLIKGGATEAPDPAARYGPKGAPGKSSSTNAGSKF
jgi:hypothetical protein